MYSMQGQKTSCYIQRFALRKLSIGTVSIFFRTLVFFSDIQVSVDMMTGTDTANVNCTANDNNRPVRKR